MTRFILATLLALTSIAIARAEPPTLPLPWVKLSEIYYTPSQARLYGSGGASINCGKPVTHTNPCNAVYVQTHLPTGSNEGPQAQNTPHVVDLVPYGVAEDAKVAWLSGLLIITHGSSSEIADIMVSFAAENDAAFNCSKYIGQTIEAATGSGQRSNFSTMVPLTNGKFKFCYRLATPGGQYPSQSSYAINLSLQAWGR